MHLPWLVYLRKQLNQLLAGVTTQATGLGHSAKLAQRKRIKVRDGRSRGSGSRREGAEGRGRRRRGGTTGLVVSEKTETNHIRNWQALAAIIDSWFCHAIDSNRHLL